MSTSQALEMYYPSLIRRSRTNSKLYTFTPFSFGESRRESVHR